MMDDTLQTLDGNQRVELVLKKDQNSNLVEVLFEDNPIPELVELTSNIRNSEGYKEFQRRKRSLQE